MKAGASSSSSVPTRLLQTISLSGLWRYVRGVEVTLSASLLIPRVDSSIIDQVLLTNYQVR